MRLFVAVNFPSDTVDILYDKVVKLKKQAISLNPSRKENLHLTLAFIGETNSSEKAKNALSGLEFEPFEISLSGMGKFARDTGDIYWVGLNKKTGFSQLSDLASDVACRLRNAGFELENRRFSPHITLARQVIINGEPDVKVLPHSIKVDKVSLMKSERIQGKLTYTEIFAVQM